MPSPIHVIRQVIAAEKVRIENERRNRILAQLAKAAPPTGRGTANVLLQVRAARDRIIWEGLITSRCDAMLLHPWPVAADLSRTSQTPFE